MGLVVKSGNEIYLSQLDTTTTGTGAAARKQRVELHLIRFGYDNFSSGCSSATLRGSYALVGQGFNTQSISSTSGTGIAVTVAPYYSTFLARIEFDGTGKLISSPATAGSLLSTLQYGGTYTVNSDCSGALTLTQQTSAGSSTTPPTDTITMRFMITPAQAFVNASGTLSGQDASSLKPGLMFSIADNNKTISGTGSAQ